MKELWSSIPDFPDHEVSTEGRVRRVRRQAGRVLTDERGKPVYFYMKNGRKYIMLGRKTCSVARIMAQVFLNEGEPLKRKQCAKVKGPLRLENLEITRFEPNTKPNGSKRAVAEWCYANTINDKACRDHLAEKHGIHLTEKTVKNYRLLAGFKKR